MDKQPTKSRIFNWFLGRIFRDIFRISIILLLILLMFEDLKPGFVLNYFDLKILLLVCSVGGIINLLIPNNIRN